jgi:hypothetical protein
MRKRSIDTKREKIQVVIDVIVVEKDGDESYSRH